MSLRSRKTFAPALTIFLIASIVQRAAGADGPQIPPASEHPVFLRSVVVDYTDGRDYPKMTGAILDSINPPSLDWYFTPVQIRHWLEEAERSLDTKGYQFVALTADKNVVDGVLRIHVSPGILAGLNHKPDQAWTYLSDRIKYAATQPLNLKRVEATAAWLNRSALINPQEPLQITLHHSARDPGLAVGDVVYTPASRFDYYIAFDNHRPPSVGAEAFEVGVSDRNLTGNGDDLSLRYTATTGGLDEIKFAGIDDLAASYKVPFTSADTFAKIAYSRTDVPFVEQPQSNLDIHSETEDVELTLGQPFYFSSAVKFTPEIGFDLRTNHSMLFGQPLAFVPMLAGGASQVTSLRVGEELNLETQYNHESLYAGINIGLPIFGSTRESDAIAGSHFVMLNLDNQYRQELPMGCQLITRCELQLSDHPLLAIEQGELGGYDTVRGYREMLLVRDNVASASAELRYPIVRGRRVQVALAPFADIGYGWDHHPAPDNPLLCSVGIGLVATVCKSVQAEIYYAHPLKDVPVYHRNLQDDGVTFSIIFRPG